MNTTTQTGKLISNFIEAIWNQQNFDRINEFLHPDFVDHSLPSAFPTGAKGLMQWINATGESFKHYTKIDEQASEGNTCIIKIQIDLTHIGSWRNIPATNKKVFITGYRCFKIKDHKIIAHYALIDGNTIENRLQDGKHGCKVQE